MMEFVRDFWGIIAAAMGAVAWLVRLESRGIANAAEVKRLWAQRKEDLQAAKDSRDRTDKRLDEISADIKTILRGLSR
nr:hypothetical protein [uncultured Roseovarius sp.]